jgi:hypothetical protein
MRNFILGASATVPVSEMSRSCGEATFASNYTAAGLNAGYVDYGGAGPGRANLP